MHSDVDSGGCDPCCMPHIRHKAGLVQVLELLANCLNLKTP